MSTHAFQIRHHTTALNLATGLLMIVAIIISSLTNTAQAIPSDKFREGELSYSLEMHRFSTKANYDTLGGSFESLPAGNQYSLINFSNDFGYGLSSKWQALASFNLGFAESTGLSGSRSNSAPTDIGGGINGRLKISSLYLLPRLFLVYPFQRTSPSTDEVSTGEGAIELHAGSFIKYKFIGVHWFGYLGLNYRDEGRAILLPWQLGVEKKWRSITLGIELDAYTSLTDDAEIDNTSKAVVTQRVNGGSSHFYSVNPERMGFNIWSNYKFSRWTHLRVGAGHTINGKNSSHGLSIFARLQWFFATEGRVRKTSISKKNRDALDNFESDSQEYDQQVFEEAEEEAPKARSKKKRKKRRKKRRKKSAEELLDEAEKSLDQAN